MHTWAVTYRADGEAFTIDVKAGNIIAAVGCAITEAGREIDIFNVTRKVRDDS